MGLFMVIVGLAGIFLGLKMRNDKLQELQDTKNHNIASNLNNNKVLDDFKPSITKRIGDYTFSISENERKLSMQYNGSQKIEQPKIVDIDNLTRFEIMQDNTTVSSGGIGSALIGGAIAGGAGAIVGANTASRKEQAESIGIKFMTRDTSNPVIRIEIYDWLDRYREKGFVEKYSAKDIYNQLEELIEVLNLVKEQQ